MRSSSKKMDGLSAFRRAFFNSSSTRSFESVERSMPRQSSMVSGAIVKAKRAAN